MFNFFLLAGPFNKSTASRKKCSFHLKGKKGIDRKEGWKMRFFSDVTMRRWTGWMRDGHQVRKKRLSSVSSVKSEWPRNWKVKLQTGHRHREAGSASTRSSPVIFTELNNNKKQEMDTIHLFSVKKKEKNLNNRWRMEQDYRIHFDVWYFTEWNHFIPSPLPHPKQLLSFDELQFTTSLPFKQLFVLLRYECDVHKFRQEEESGSYRTSTFLSQIKQNNASHLKIYMYISSPSGLKTGEEKKNERESQENLLKEKFEIFFFLCSSKAIFRKWREISGELLPPFSPLERQTTQSFLFNSEKNGVKRLATFFDSHKIRKREISSSLL